MNRFGRFPAVLASAAMVAAGLSVGVAEAGSAAGSGASISGRITTPDGQARWSNVDLYRWDAGRHQWHDVGEGQGARYHFKRLRAGRYKVAFTPTKDWSETWYGAGNPWHGIPSNSEGFPKRWIDPDEMHGKMIVLGAHTAAKNEDVVVHKGGRLTRALADTQGNFPIVQMKYSTTVDGTTPSYISIKLLRSDGPAGPYAGTLLAPLEPGTHTVGVRIWPDGAWQHAAVNVAAGGKSDLGLTLPAKLQGKGFILRGATPYTGTWAGLRIYDGSSWSLDSDTDHETYRWLVDGVPTNQTGHIYKVRRADLGHKITLEVHRTRAGYQPGVATASTRLNTRRTHAAIHLSRSTVTEAMPTPWP